jgi:serine phosphatase RsbU (regulator of sigma subunit)
VAGVPAQVFDPVRLAAVRDSGLLDTPAEANFDRLAGLASMLLGAPFAFVTVVDETRSFWKSCIGIDSDDINERQNPVEQSFCQYVIGTGEPLIVGDVAADPRTADNPSIALMGVAAWAGYPLLGPQGQILGTFCVVDTVVREWTEQHVQILATLAAAAGAEIALRDSAIAATNATIAARQSERRLAFLAAASEILATIPDAEQAVGMLAEQIVTLLCDWCLITIVDETGQVRDIGRAHSDPSRVADVERYAEVHRVDSAAPSAQALATGQVVFATIDEELLRQSLLDPRAHEALARLRPAFAAVYPLRGRGEPFGSVALVNEPERGQLTDSESGIARELVRRAGLSLENARLHSQQRRIADTLQSSLLTTPPPIPGLEIEVRYRPAAEDAQVGGDWYDVFSQPDGSTMLVIGDVVGHDLEAISVMGQIRTMMRSIGYDRAASPAQLLSRVDELLTGLRIRTLCTALIMNLRPRPGGGLDVTWSAAGHPTPLVVDAAGQAKGLDAPADLMLGVRSSCRRHDYDETVASGSTLLLMTDGLFERRTVTYDEGLDEVRGALSALSSLPLSRLCDDLLAAVAPEHPEDDIALIAVREAPASL